MDATRPGAKLWIVIGRPTRLPGALVAVNALNPSFPGGCYLLRDDSSWWRKADWEEFESEFAATYQFQRVPTCRGLADVARLYRDLSRRKREMAALPINPGCDLVLCLASVTGLANTAASIHPRARKILCLSKSDFERLNQNPDRLRYRFTTSGWLQNRAIEPLIGLNRTLHFKPRINPGGDGVRLVRLEKTPQQIYDALVVMSNRGADSPALSSSRIVSSRFPSIAELPPRPAPGSRANALRKVVFFGTPFLLVENISPNEYVSRLNRCLEFIRANYPGSELVYRPHPAETDEPAHLHLTGFTVEDDREPAELYFLRRFAEIEAVYSVSSTVSRVALNNGLNAYALWKCFPFPDTAARFFANMMGDVPPQFEIADLDKPPIRYQQNMQNPSGTRSFSEALTVAADLSTRVR